MSNSDHHNSDLPMAADELDHLDDFDLDEFLDEDEAYEEGDFDNVT